MKILHTDVDRKIAFVAVQVSDKTTRMASLSGVVVYWSLDGSAAAAMTTPTATPIDATNMLGDFWLDIDEAAMVTLASAVDFSELVDHIEATNMEPVTRAIPVERFSPGDDEELNTGTTPWQMDRKREDGVTILSKKLRDKDGADITRVGVTIGSLKTS